VSLDGSGSYDLDGNPLSYNWVQESGAAVSLLDSDSPYPWFVSPVGLALDEELVFRLEVSDGEYVSGDTVSVMVIATNPVNRAPVADAGVAQTVNEGVQVLLDGSGSSDPDGDPLDYSWSQVSGAAVNLVNAATATPGFAAPTGLAADENLIFELTVSDGELTGEVATVTITVLATPAGGLNIAGLAIAQASSQANSDQSALKAIDGCIDGYPGDSTCEWVARYQEPKIGAWLELSCRPVRPPEQH